jgi:glycosyltransferase involved in cell wall biosynthesis
MSSAVWCSIVIPTYNYARFVGRAIDSALEQPGPTREVIVVDDGSTDHTPDVLAAYGDRIRAIRQTNQGVSAARNAGIAAARGDYIVCLDADDRLLPDGLTRLKAAADANPQAAMVFGAYQTVDERGHVRRASPPPRMSTPLRNFYRFLLREFTIGNGRAAMRRELFDRIRYPVGLTHGEDIVVFGQILANYPVVSLADCVAESYEHPSRARNNLSALLRNGAATIDALFCPALLPPPALAWRPVFAAVWYAELARGAFKAGDHRQARALYLTALRTYWPVLVRGRHLTRWLRTYWPIRRAA